MRCNWLRVAVCAVALAVGGNLARPAVAAGNDEFIYVHDTLGSVHITHLDERDGGLLPIGSVSISTHGPNCSPDCQSLGYSKRFHILVIANGNGGAGDGSISTARVGLDGRLTILHQTTVAGSGDLTGVQVRQTRVGVWVYATDPTNNTVYTFTLNSNGILSQVGAPVPTGQTPIGLTHVNSFLFVANSGSADISIYLINESTGALTPAAATVPVEGAANPRTIHSEGEFVYVADCNPLGNATAPGTFFVYRVRGPDILKENGSSPFVTADASICSFSICSTKLAVIGLHAATTIQTGILKKGVPTGRGATFKLRTAYEVGSFESSDCRYLVVARSGPNGIVRSLHIGGNQGRIINIPNGVAPMSTGAGFVNGMFIVDP